MIQLSPQSIRGKVVSLVLLVSTFSLLLASTVFVANGLKIARDAKTNQLTALAQLIASNSTAALSFYEAEAATELLESLASRPTIQYACLLEADREVLATYRRNPADAFLWELPSEEGHAFHDNRLEVLLPVVLDGDQLGEIYIAASLEDLNQQFKVNLTAVAMAMALALAVASVLTLQLERLISEPILQLAKTAKKISEEGNYSTRVAWDSNDEMGQLYRSFNLMLAHIQKGEEKLLDAHDQLEVRVAERTEQLSDANMQLKREMSEREALNSRMLELSHRAGKAEVATGVLHNVGNVLNSINVSASLVEESLRLSRIPSLKKAAGIMQEQPDIARFIANDDRGKALPEFLVKVAEKISEERDHEAQEIRTLMDHLDHVKTIVAMQQSYAGVSGLLEPVSLPKLIDDAQMLNAYSLERHGVEVIHEIEELPEVMVERQKLVQILVNLLKNAKDAITDSDTENRKLTIRIHRHGEDRLRISTIDTGVGITPENLTNIFSHGFTTKEDGHGFGLHSCANAAGEMGGSLTVESAGPGLGATFTLDLPYRPADMSEQQTREMVG